MTASRETPVRVVVVEDSPLQRTHLVQLLREDDRIQVVGEAGTVPDAVAVVARTRPDVVTMDLEIPGGPPDVPGGIVATERISERAAVPILILSAHASSNGDVVAIDALDAGAVDVFPKASPWTRERAAALRRRVVVLSRVAMVSRRRPPVAPAPRGPAGTAGPVVGLVASTGGPTALREVIAPLAGLRAPILVVQHIHPEFAASFATWLGQATGVQAALAQDGERPVPGRVYVAPPETHLRLGPGGELTLSPEPELLARPSGDELLRSLADHAGSGAVAAVLTGMGYDGARGLLAIRRRGGATFAQDAATSVVDGMPKVARDLGAAGGVLPIDRLGTAVADAIRVRTRAVAT